MAWLVGLVSRRRGRLAATAAGVAVAVALLASIGSFLSASKGTMTARAVAGVAVDWQVQAQPGADPAAVLQTVQAAPGVTTAVPVGFADTSGLQATSGNSTRTTGPGVVVGIPDNYAATFPGQLRQLAGADRGALLAQQTAANLHAVPGDTISVGRTGLPPGQVRVDGVVDLPQADSLFQHVGAPPGGQRQAPPDNVVLLPAAQWHALFDPLAAVRPDLVRTQIHARLSRRLPADPAAAFAQATGRARNLEVRLAGGGIVGDNLAASLDAARSDALYAQVLFLFLGLPGAVLAALLTAAAAGAGAARRRGEQALLRARGFRTGALVRLAAVEAAAVGAAGAVAGLAGALVVGRVVFGAAGFGKGGRTVAMWAVACGGVGLAIAAATVVVPAWRDARGRSVAAGRRPIGRLGTPRWARFGLDAILLAVGLALFWLVGRSGYQLVLAPEGVPSISVSYWAFAAPALIWVGAGLLVWRVADLGLARGRPLVGRLVRGISAGLAGTVAAGLARQRRMVSRCLVLVALATSFAASTAIFNATYRQQADVDARLTNGGDVTVTESPGASLGLAEGSRLARVAGVRQVEPLQHRFVYVGADLQDLYGVRPGTIVSAAKLQDAYFQGGSARRLMRRLAAQPDAILVSAETVRDFQLNRGDPIRLRIQDGRTKQFTTVPFRYAGVVKEFPTAPRDSFLVANAEYVARMTGSDAVAAFLIDTGGSAPAAVAGRVRAVVGPEAHVSDIETSRRVVGSSLTAVDLAGLTRVELGFALALAAASAGLMLGLGMAERRRTFALAAALGATARQLGGFVWAEAAYVTAGGLIAGAAVGWVLSHVLVKVLTGVFDPPPAALAVPWAYLVGVATITVAAVAIAAVVAVRVARRPALDVLREL